MSGAAQRRVWATVLGVLAVAGIWWWFFHYSRKAHGVVAGGSPATLEIVNLSEARWKLHASGRGAEGDWEISPKSVTPLRLPAGDYTFTQTLLQKTGAGATRTVTFRLDAGVAYRWKLVTLLTKLDDAPGGGNGGKP